MWLLIGWQLCWQPIRSYIWKSWLVIHDRNSEFPSQRPVTRSFDVFFDLRLNKRLSKQSKRRWFETSSCSLWRHCDENLTQKHYHANSYHIHTLSCSLCHYLTSFLFDIFTRSAFCIDINRVLNALVALCNKQSGRWPKVVAIFFLLLTLVHIL